MARVTLNAINKAIAAAGGKEQLFRGKDYFYFGEGEADGWKETGVYGLFHLSGFTIERWVAEWKQRKEDNK